MKRIILAQTSSVIAKTGVCEPGWFAVVGENDIDVITQFARFKAITFFTSAYEYHYYDGKFQSATHVACLPSSRIQQMGKHSLSYRFHTTAWIPRLQEYASIITPMTYTFGHGTMYGIRAIRSLFNDYFEPSFEILDLPYSTTISQGALHTVGLLPPPRQPRNIQEIVNAS